MKVLFVCSASKQGSISPFILSQGISLKKEGIDLDFFGISGGLNGYISSISVLRKKLKKSDYKVIHAHYGLSAITVWLARRKEKLVVSFMGDDLLGSNDANGNVLISSKLMALVNRFLANRIYNFNIVKSKEMTRGLKKTKTEVIPNGIDFSVFYPMDKVKARKLVNYNQEKRILLFISDQKRQEKNYKLAVNAVNLLEENDVELKLINGIKHAALVNYYNAADALLLTSFHEGSPNVIKEAMACNCPIVSTNVGDVEWVFGNIEGCYITDFSPEDVAEKLRLAIEFNKATGRTNGREQIKKLGLNSNTVTKKIIRIYNKLVFKNDKNP